MSTDKLNRTARAAGFAMACEEAAPAPPVAAIAHVPTVQDAVRSASHALAPLKQAKSQLGWNPAAWSFWKTA